MGEIFDVFVSQVMEEIIEVVKHISQEPAKNSAAEQIVDVPVAQSRKKPGPFRPKIGDQIVEVAKQHTGEQIAGAPVHAENQPGVPDPGVRGRACKDTGHRSLG